MVNAKETQGLETRLLLLTGVSFAQNIKDVGLMTTYHLFYLIQMFKNESIQTKPSKISLGLLSL